MVQAYSYKVDMDYLCATKKNFQRTSQIASTRDDQCISLEEAKEPVARQDSVKPLHQLRNAPKGNSPFHSRKRNLSPNQPQQAFSSTEISQLQAENAVQSGGLYSRIKRKNICEVTLEDVADLDSIALCCDEPAHLALDTSRIKATLDATSFKPFKQLSREEKKAATAKNSSTQPRRLPFASSKRPSAPQFQPGCNPLQTHSLSELEHDYYQSLIDINGRFQKYVPKICCHGDSQIVEFRLALADGKIWRTFRMDASTTFSDLRRAILDLMHWNDEKSWGFMYVSKENKVVMVGRTAPLKSDSEIQSEERLVVIETLHESYCRFCFVYDLLGATWRVDLFLLKVLDKEPEQMLPVCVRGKGLLSFSAITSPQRLLAICSVLKDPTNPNHSEYLSSYGNLLAPVSVTDTPFPSFYTSQGEQRGKERKKRKVEEGPILVSLPIGGMVKME